MCNPDLDRKIHILLLKEGYVDPVCLWTVIGSSTVVIKWLLLTDRP